MTLKERMIMEQYRQSKADFQALGEAAEKMLTELLKQQSIESMGVSWRVKAEDSLAGKLARKGDRYQSLDDLTDILGMRVICFYHDDVDRIGKMIEQRFIVDWENSVDKRAILKEDTFGYLSLHYICALDPAKGDPEQLCGKWFEIQVRSVLQHTWATIQHDMGYKSEFGVPRVVAREFSRIAGLLEIADDQFARIRDSMKQHTETVRRKIADDMADELSIDIVSLREYMRSNKQMKAFIGELAAISGAEIDEIDPESYIKQLAWLGKKTLGELRMMLEENHDTAYAMAKATLEAAELDILATTAALRFLCRAELLRGEYTEQQMTEFFTITAVNKQRAERQAAALIKQRG